MRIYIISTFLLFCFSVDAKADTLKNNINDVINLKDTTYLMIDKGQEIFQQKSEWWNSPGFVALITVIITGIIGFLTNKYITQKSITIQIQLAEKQVELANKQLTEQSKITIESIRANNISNARINWIEALRPIMGRLISDTAIFEYELQRRMEQTPNKKIDPNERLYQKLSDLNLAFNEVKLFLNHEEDEHLEFINYVNSYIDKSVKIASGESLIDNSINEEGLIVAARKILKNAWEQAKNDVKLIN